MFTSYPTYDRYRTLKLATPQLHGEDVYALQSALLTLGFKLPQFGADGYFGQETDTAVRAAQKQFAIVGGVDGLAGGHTQEALAVQIINRVATSAGVPVARLYGSCSHESGFRLGNYSVLYGDGSFDAGVAQENTDFVDAKHGFTPLDAITALGNNTKQYYVLFEGLATDRRWDLAQGAWNAPAFACYYAKKEGATKVTTSQTKTPTPDQALTFENYVASVSAFA